MPNGNKPMYQPWSEEEFAADLFVQAMTPIQKWMYRTLLQKAFVCQTRPYLPDDDSVLWVLAGCENQTQWTENMAPIRKMFKNKSNKLYQKRVLMDYEKWSELIEKRRFAGERSAAARVEQVSTHDEQGSKEVSNISKLSKAQYPETKISEIWEQRSGRITEPKNQFKKELKELIRVYGEDEVLSQFEIWATLNNGNYYKRPISAFIKQYTGTTTVNGNLFNSAEINDLAVELSFLSGGDITFNRLNLNGLALLLRDFSQDELITAFKKFYSENEQDPQWAAKDFVEKAPQLILVARKQQTESARRQEEIERIKAQVQSESASTIAVNEAQAAQDEELLRDTIGTFGLEEKAANSSGE